MTPAYKPLPPDRLYLTETEWSKHLDDAALARLLHQSFIQRIDGVGRA